MYIFSNKNYIIAFSILNILNILFTNDFNFIRRHNPTNVESLHLSNYTFLPDLILLLLTLFLILKVAQALKKHPIYSHFFLVITICLVSKISYAYFSNYNFSLSLVLLTWNIILASEAPIFNIKSLIYIFQPFTISSSLPRENISYLKYITRDKDLKNILNAGFLIIRGILVILIFKNLDGLIAAKFGSSTFENQNNSIYKVYSDVFLNYSKFDRSTLALIIFYDGISFLFGTYYGFLSLSIGVLRLLGLNFATSTNKPWEAKSFNEFCSRFMYYYSFLINKYFYYFFIKKLKNLTYSKKLSIFLSVSFGGIIFHILRDWNYFLKSENSFMLNLIFYFKNVSLYFFVWGLFCTLKFKLIESANKYIRFLLYIILYVCIFSLRKIIYFPDIKSFSKLYIYILNFF